MYSSIFLVRLDDATALTPFQNFGPHGPRIVQTQSLIVVIFRELVSPGFTPIFRNSCIIRQAARGLYENRPGFYVAAPP